MTSLLFEVTTVGFGILVLLAFESHLLNRYECNVAFSIRKASRKYSK